MSASTQSAFARALLDPALPVPPGVISFASEAPARRYGVHRNNVVAGLVEALRVRFPAIERIVGEEFFRAMARVFVTEQPPKSPLLMRFGDELGDFLDDFAPAAELPYLADVARLEAARTRAYHAADAAPIASARLAGLDPRTVGALRLVLHPSVEIIRSRHPIVTILEMNTGAAEPGPIASWNAQDALVARPGLDVEIRALPPGGAAFLQAIAGGEPLALAANIALAENDNFDLAGNLAGLFGAGLAIDIITPEPAKDRTP